MKREFLSVADMQRNAQHDCDFVTLSRKDGSQYSIGEFAFGTKPKVGDKLVMLTAENGSFVGYRAPLIRDRILSALGY